jgi:hypothetical protein
MIGPENALALRRQISYSLDITSLLRWQVESATYNYPTIIHLQSIN